MTHIPDLDKEQLEQMTDEQFLNFVENAVYDATSIVERMEFLNRVEGNGHHIRQSIAEVARIFVSRRLTNSGLH